MTVKAELQGKKEGAVLSLQEIFYYLFFGLLLFAKGIGLYDGQGSFRIFLVLALICWGMKMLLTRWSWREAAAAALLVCFGFAAYRSSGEKAALISVLVVTGMKDIPLRRVFRIGLAVWTPCFFCTLFLALTGVTEPLMLVHEKAGLGYVVRNSLGYTHPNVLHISYMILIAFWFYVFPPGKGTVVRAVLAAFCGNFFIFLYSLSYTGFAMTAVYLILILYFNLRSQRTKAEDGVLQCLMPVCVLTSLFAPLLLKGQAFEIMDKIVNWRFRLSRRYLRRETISLFGTPVVMDAGSIDCSYVYCLLFYGIVLFALFMLGYFFLIRYLLKKNRTKDLALVLGMVAAGFTEPFQFNFSFKNLILPILGAWLYEELLRGRAAAGAKIPSVQIIRADWKIPIPDLCRPIREWLHGFLRSKVPGGMRFRLAAAAVCLAGAAVGACLGAGFQVPPYVVVDKTYSDRVGGREDYLIFGELPEEIVENSMQIHCTDPDTMVYVFEGNTVRMEQIRRMIGMMLAGAAAGCILVCLAGVWIYERKRGKQGWREEHYTEP